MSLNKRETYCTDSTTERVFGDVSERVRRHKTHSTDASVKKNVQADTYTRTRQPLTPEIWCASGPLLHRLVIYDTQNCLYVYVRVS